MKLGVVGSDYSYVREELLSFFNNLGAKKDASEIIEKDYVYYIGDNNKIKKEININYDKFKIIGFFANTKFFFFKKNMTINVGNETAEIISIYENDANLYFKLSNNNIYDLNQMLELFFNSLKKLKLVKNNCQQIYKRTIKETNRKYKKKKFTYITNLNSFNQKERLMIFDFIYEDLEKIIDTIYYKKEERKQSFYQDIIKRLEYCGITKKFTSNKALMTEFFKSFCLSNFERFIAALIYGTYPNIVEVTKFNDIINAFWGKK